MRDSYLEPAERIVRHGATWMNEEGRIIDPYEKKETNTATARFVGALGLLLTAGRCEELEELCAKALTPALEDLYYNRTDWGEFIVKEAIQAYAYLKDRSPRQQVKRWARMLSEYDPVKWYKSTRDGILDHNYVTFVVAGEMMKRKLGLADNIDFIEACIEKQLRLFDEHGMYHDPGCPLTYDITARMNLSLAMWAGYEGKHRNELADVLHRGAMAQLQYQSPTGECPFGGRSSQQNFNEITFAILCEYQAIQEHARGDVELAGQLKRAAVLAFTSIEKYVRETPVFFNKNKFPPDTQHGRQKGYGFYGAYSLLIASQLGFARLLADDTLVPKPCPAETGGVLFVTDKGFNKVFATTKDYHVEIDRNPPNPEYDATGLGRLHAIGFPTDLALSMPINAVVSYLTVTPPAPENVVIGPGCDRVFLASLQGESLQSTVNIEKQSKTEIRFTITYSRSDELFVTERYAVSPAGVRIQAHGPGASEMNFRVPLLKTNGRDETVITRGDDGFTVMLKLFEYSARCLNPAAGIVFEDFEAPNRNGIYRIGRMNVPGDTIDVLLTLNARE